MSTPFKSVAFHTLGCKLNFSESSTIARKFVQSGYRAVDFHEPADIYILNTCSVTENADRKCRKIIRQIRRDSPESVIAVTGCYAHLKPDEISKIDGINLIVGNGEKFDIPAYIEKNHFNGKPVLINHRAEAMESFHSSWSMGERTRVFLKIQDGCDYPCTYCTIPLARGNSRSDSVENILRHAYHIVKSGIKEIVLTGVNVGEFRSPDGQNFFHLLQKLEKIPQLDRLRISSIEPNLLTNEIIDLIAGSHTLVPHFHIPLQSGSDRILASMRRRYNVETYATCIKKIRKLLPDANIGADIIVGFPGENQNDFEMTRDLISKLDLSYLHVFSFSPRENTAACKMPDSIPQDVIMHRSKALHQISDQQKSSFFDRFLGTTQDVLFESYHEGEWTGHTRNFIKVRLSGLNDLGNRILPVKLIQNYHSFIKGEVQ